APSLAIDVPDPLAQDEAPLRIDLVWRDRKAMRPSAIAQQVPVLRALVEARKVVADVAARRRPVDAARAELTRILPRGAWVDAVLRDAGKAGGIGDAVGTRNVPESRASSALDALLDLV